MANKTKKYLLEMISDVDGDVSSKRIIGFVFTTAVLITWYLNLIYAKPIEQFIFDGLLYIIGIALATTAAEKFSRKNNTEQSNVEETNAE
jgi:hypothetical protein